MRSFDPLKNFPELDGLDPRRAEDLRRETQKRISRQPPILAGLIATIAIAAALSAWAVPVDSLLDGLLLGCVVGLFAVIYLVIVVKPRMRAEFRRQGFLPRP